VKTTAKLANNDTITAGKNGMSSSGIIIVWSHYYAIFIPQPININLAYLKIIRTLYQKSAKVELKISYIN
ncbi:MAG: hypothetical protein QG673_556, partial [Pseudomonadota bacterium]|nr:hypothetical protein [Pseudomonadota bacterium]